MKRMLVNQQRGCSTAVSVSGKGSGESFKIDMVVVSGATRCRGLATPDFEALPAQARLKVPIDRAFGAQNGDFDEVMTRHVKPNLSTAMFPLCCRLVGAEAGIQSL